MLSPHSPLSPVSPSPLSPSQLSPGRTSYAGSVASSATCSVLSSKSKGIEIPTMWRPDVEVCIREKSLNDSARDEIVRHLVNLLFSYSAKPTRADCDQLARKLILTYPWMRNDMGSGYVSVFMYI